jgi:hypothetical protein
MLSIVETLAFWRNSEVDDGVVGGADTVFQAILEKTDGGRRYTVYLGEPELVDRGGQLQSDYMVRIPTETESGDPEPPNLEYELPGDDMEEGDDDLFELLELYGIEAVADLGQLAGETVFGVIEGGSLTLRFDELRDDSEDEADE